MVMLYMKPLPPTTSLRRQRTKTGCVSCREARKKCCERTPGCTRCSIKNLTCVYEESPSSRQTKRASRALPPSLRKGRKAFPGKKPKPEDGFIHTFAVSKSALSRSMSSGDSRSIDCAVSSQSDLSLCSSVDLDEPISFLEGYYDPFCEMDACSMLTNNNIDSNTILYDSSSSRISDSDDLMSLSLDLSVPLFSEFTPDTHSRKLLHHFCGTLSRLLVFVEQPNNSFHDLVVPLAYDHSPVLHAICALAGGHLEHMGVQEGRHSSDYRALAAKGAFELVQWKCQQEEVLATIMLLAYYESLTMSSEPDVVVGHLKAAFLIISSVPESEQSPAMRFLEGAFQYFDVISALSLEISPVSAIPVSDYTYPLAIMPSAKPGAIKTHDDPFLGLAGHLWPIFYRLGLVTALKGDLESATAANQSTKAAVLRVEYESMTKATEKALQDWQPAITADSIKSSSSPSVHEEDDTTAQQQHHEKQQQFKAMFYNSQAYRHSALVYLHRAVYGQPASHPQIQMNAHLALESCAAVVASGGSVHALLWPLYVAACEAVTDHDQSLARLVFSEMTRRQKLVNVERAWDTTLSKWRGMSLRHLGTDLATGLMMVDSVHIERIIMS